MDWNGLINLCIACLFCITPLISHMKRPLSDAALDGCPTPQKRARIEREPLLHMFKSTPYTVPLNPLTQLANAPACPVLQIDVPIKTDCRSFTLRFVQCSREQECDSGDRVFCLDKRVPELTAAWSNTTRIDNELFSLERRHQARRYAHYHSAAQLLLQVLQAAEEHEGSIYSVVMVCRRGRERSLLLLMVWLSLLHALHTEQAHALPLGALAATAHATEKFKGFFNVLEMHLSPLLV